MWTKTQSAGDLSPRRGSTREPHQKQRLLLGQLILEAEIAYYFRLSVQRVLYGAIVAI